MRSAGRVLSVGALALLLVALPGNGLAASPGGLAAGSVGARAVALPGGPGSHAPAPGVVAVTAAQLAVSGWAFTPWYYWQDVRGMSGSCAWNSTNTDALETSLEVPTGITITTLTADLYDNDPTYDGALSLYRANAAGVYTLLATATSSGSTGPQAVSMPLSSPETVSAGYNYYLWFVPGVASTGNMICGAAIGYTNSALSLYPITPVRVFDSRFSGFGGPIAYGGSRTVNVKDAINTSTGVVTITNAIPQGARAVAFNLTVTGTVGAGWVAVVPGTSTTVATSTINWSASGTTIANGGVVALGSGTAERQITLVVGGHKGCSTQAIVDITGYYQ